MTQSIRYNKLTRNCKGFTLIELLVVTVLIGLLLSSGIYFVDISQKRQNIELSSVQINALRNFPAAILQVYQSRLTLVGLKVLDLTSTNEVVQNQPVDWQITGTPTQDTVMVVFTLNDNRQASDLLVFLNSSLDTTLVSAVAVDSGDDKNVVVTYSV